MLTPYEVAASLRDAVHAGLTASPVVSGSVPSRVCVVPGEVAWDACDCASGGQLAVSITRVYPSVNFPTEAGFTALESRSDCPPPWRVAEIIVSVLRCAPSPQENAVAPSCDALDATARLVDADATVTWAAVSCRVTELERSGGIGDFIVRASTFVGPQGACVGSELRVLVALPAGCPCG